MDTAAPGVALPQIFTTIPLWITIWSLKGPPKLKVPCPQSCDIDRHRTPSSTDLDLKREG